MQSNTGDLHSNAFASTKAIRLSDKLLEHHKGHNEEILAIVAHELGHVKLNHIMWMIVFNTFYMLFFGIAMLSVIENRDFLRAFNIYMESSFLTFVLFAKLYETSADVFIRMLILWIERRNEYAADAFSVRIGFGSAAYTALIRNFA